MKLSVLYGFYLWILLTHCLFIGVTAFAFFGKKLISWPSWQVLLILILPLLFIEFYWLPIVNYLQIYLVTDSEVVLNHFGISEGENMIDHFRLGYFHLLIMPLAGYLSYRIGLWSYKRKQ